MNDYNMGKLFLSEKKLFWLDFKHFLILMQKEKGFSSIYSNLSGRN